MIRIMKYTHLLLLALLLTACSKNDDENPDEMQEIPVPETGFVPCENGMAGVYPCNGYDLLGFVSLSTFQSQAGNDIWGWTDSTTGKEYALMGLDDGTAFIDISDTENLIYLGKLPTATTSSGWRDIKVYNDFAIHRFRGG